MGKKEKMEKANMTDTRFDNLNRLSDMVDRLEPQTDSMFKFNIIVPYSDGPDVKPVLWNF